MAASPAGPPRLYTGSQDGKIRVWARADDGGGGLRQLRQLSGQHDDTVWALAVSLNGRRLFSGSADTTIGVWCTRSGGRLQTLRGHTDEVLTLALAPNGGLYSGSSDYTIRVWEPSTAVGQAHRAGPAVSGDRRLSVLPQKEAARAGSGGGGGGGATTSASSCTPLAPLCELDLLLTDTWYGHDAEVCALVATGNGRGVISGADDGSIHVWSRCDTVAASQSPGTGTGGSGSDGNAPDHKREPVHIELAGHCASIKALVESPDGRLFSGSYDSTIRVW